LQRRSNASKPELRDEEAFVAYLLPYQNGDALGTPDSADDDV
jgi:hypothetical protein